MTKLANCAISAVERRLHEEIPISSYMGFRIRSFTGEHLSAFVDFERNKNVHGTAFGGSLYSVAALTGWALLYLRGLEHQLQDEPVIIKAEARYLRPVQGEIECISRLPDADFDRYLKKIERFNQGKVEIISTIMAEGRVAFEVVALYGVKRI
jgi:thioesterase domain-containing protein